MVRIFFLLYFIDFKRQEEFFGLTLHRLVLRQVSILG